MRRTGRVLGAKTLEPLCSRLGHFFFLGSGDGAYFMVLELVDIAIDTENHAQDAIHIYLYEILGRKEEVAKFW